MDILQLADILHREDCSCVIWNEGKISLFHQRGIKDLYALWTENPLLLNGAIVADKVIGKGAAALMVAGYVKSVYANVISIPALELLNSTDIPVKYETCVPHIINRAGTGLCPVEKLCLECKTVDECILHIEQFINPT